MEMGCHLQASPCLEVPMLDGGRGTVVGARWTTNLRSSAGGPSHPPELGSAVKNGTGMTGGQPGNGTTLL